MDENSDLPGDDDDLVHNAHLLHHWGHGVVDLLSQWDDIVVLRAGGKRCGLRIFAGDWDGEVVAAAGSRTFGVGGVDTDGDFGFANDVAAVSDG